MSALAVAEMRGSSVEQPWCRSRLRYLADLRHQSGTDRNSVAKARLGQLPLRIAGYHHRLCGVDRGRCPQRSQKCRHVGLEKTCATEDDGINGHKEMSDVHAEGFLRVFGMGDERCTR